MEEDLYNFDVSCPKCGGKTTKKQIGLANFIMCQDVVGCDYYEIEEIESIINDPSEERIKWEKLWYKERFNIFIRKEKNEIKKNFIAKEMERLKREYLKTKSS
ncbi:MAG: hypothetical protein LBB45_02875 [Methanobrevibacter sp.]|jgi:ssDNA-binding Zn-finger/Zn-ribbon topoisomerase 1|nr:hypothetical protein [Candidatus Methanovirga basalitermitum]